MDGGSTRIGFELQTENGIGKILENEKVKKQFGTILWEFLGNGGESNVYLDGGVENLLQKNNGKTVNKLFYKYKNCPKEFFCMLKLYHLYHNFFTQAGFVELSLRNLDGLELSGKKIKSIKYKYAELGDKIGFFCDMNNGNHDHNSEIVCSNVQYIDGQTISELYNGGEIPYKYFIFLMGNLHREIYKRNGLEYKTGIQSDDFEGFNQNQMGGANVKVRHVGDELYLTVTDVAKHTGYFIRDNIKFLKSFFTLNQIKECFIIDGEFYEHFYNELVLREGENITFI